MSKQSATNERLLGLESGGTKLVTTVTTATGRILATRQGARPSGNRAEATVSQLAALGQAVLAEAGCRPGDLQAVGWGFGGTVDRQTNRPDANPHEPGWEGLDAVGDLAAAFGAPVFCENDCNVAALAEAQLGAGTVQGTTVYVTVGSGIGAGIVLDGEILALSPWGEGEFGHLVLEPGGPVCACGNRGCLEAFCSGWGIASRVREQATAYTENSELVRQLPTLPQEQIAAALFAAYPDDPLASLLVTQFVQRMALASSYLVNLLAPARLLFGGGVMQSQWLVAAIAEQTWAFIPPHFKIRPEIVPAQLGSLAVSQGAALFAGRQLARNHQNA